MDEMPIEVHEAEEGLDVLNLMGLGPILDGFNFLQGHGQSGRREDITEVLHSVGMEFALLRVGVESVSVQLSEDLSDVLLMGSLILRVD